MKTILNKLSNWSKITITKLVLQSVNRELAEVSDRMEILNRMHVALKTELDVMFLQKQETLSIYKFGKLQEKLDRVESDISDTAHEIKQLEFRLLVGNYRLLGE